MAKKRIDAYVKGTVVVEIERDTKSVPVQSNRRPAPKIERERDIAPKVDRRHRINAEEWIDSGKWVLVKSSNVKGIAYQKTEKYLLVEFKGGSIYRYDQVLPKDAADMFNSDSMGKFVHQRLKGNYQYKKVS